MIHPATKITAIAKRYYKIVHPERKYSDHYAIRQWRQDKKIDVNIVESILLDIFKEQRKMIQKVRERL